MGRGKPAVSVIIPAINEEKYIHNALDGLRKQTFKDFEIIVVDGGSRDRTREIAGKVARVVTYRKRGAGRARNYGARIAKGDILLFIDADTKPSEDLIGVYHEAMTLNPGVAAATGPVLPLEKASPRYRWGYRFVSVTFVQASMLLGRPSFMGSNFAVSARAFRQAHGFNERLVTYEDWDLSNRIKRYGRMMFLGNAKVYTSIRRVRKWGMSGYFAFYLDNFFRYHLFNESKKNYRQVR